MQVVLYDPHSPLNYHAAWSKNFRDADPGNRRIQPLKGGDFTSLADEIEKGARIGGGGSTIIFACGHGGAEGTGGYGFADIAPPKKFRIGRNWTDGPGSVDVFYDVDFGNRQEGSELAHDSAVYFEIQGFDTPVGQQALKNKFKTNPQLIPAYIRDQKQYWRDVGEVRLTRWLAYKRIGYAFQRNGVNLVVFLTCRMGQTEMFVKKVSSDWGIKIRAYRKYIWFGDGADRQHPRAYLDGDPSDDLSKADQSANIPSNPQYFYTAGPLPGTEARNEAFWRAARLMPAPVTTP